MKKNILIAVLFAVALLSAGVQNVYAVSAGYERFEDSKSEVYVEYLPIVPYDPTYPTASEEFPIMFYVWQYHQWYWLGPVLMHSVPDLFKMSVYYRDTVDFSDYVAWKRWYPISTSQTGVDVSWTLGGTYGPLTVRATLDVPPVGGIYTNYNQYYSTGPDGKTYLHVADLEVDYSQHWLWENTYTEGAGSLGIPNDATQPHQGHHVVLWIQLELWWADYDFLGEFYGWDKRSTYFIIGDDNPANTDSWLTVQEGPVSFTEDWPDGCVAEGTLVTMADGSIKPVEKIKKGDQVLGFWPTNGSYMVENVLDVTKTKVEVIVNINYGRLRLTPLDQPIFIRNSTYEGWVRDSATIQVGWEIYNATSNGWVPVSSITYEEGKTRAYDLVLDGYTTYIANGILVMDKNGGGGGC